MNMKKLLYIFSLLALATSCELFELDNYDGPDAAISGNIIELTVQNSLKHFEASLCCISVGSLESYDSSNSFVPSLQSV